MAETTTQTQLIPVAPFELERYFAQHEFSAPYLLCCSDMEPLKMSEVLAMADEEMSSKWENLSLGYTESRGDPILIKEIASMYDSIPSEGPLAPIVIAPQEGVLLAMQAMLSPSKGAVVCVSPAYQSLHEVANTLGCQMICWNPELNESGVPFKYSIDTLRKLIATYSSETGGSVVQAVIVNFPHNPTGCLISEAELRGLVQICSDLDAYLFSDEMYRFLEYDISNRLPSAIECGYEKTVVLCGVSKSLSCPGLRIGWLLSKDEQFLAKITQLKDYTTICSSAPSEVLATVVLRARETILQRNIDIISNNLQLLRAFFTKHNDRFEWVEPLAGSICFPRLKADIDIRTYCDKLVDAHGILLLPASVYTNCQLPCFRLGLGRKDLPDILDRWEASFGDTPIKKEQMVN